MPNWKKLITSGSSATLSGLTLSGVATPEILFNGTSDAGVDFAIKATPEGLNFYEPEDSNKVHFQIKDDAGVSATYGYQVNGTSVISSGRVLQNVSGNISMFSNDSGYITDGNTGWNNTYGFTTCTGTTTPSNTQTFTNKSGNISQWTNDSGYITDGNTGWNNSYGFTTCTGTTTPSNTQTFTNKGGNISQWTNDSGYITDGNTGWNNTYGFTTCTGTVNTSGTVNACEFPRFSDADTVVALTAAEMQAALNIADGATNVTNNNQLTNGCGYITDGNTNWNNSYGFTTCTGTTTPSNTQTFTNKSGNISQWTNNSGYTTCTGTTTPSNSQTFTNKSGNISQWTNDSGYITDGNTGWNNTYGFTTCTGDITAVCISAGAGLTGDVFTTSGAHLQTINVDASVVRTSGNQTIDGIKTFNLSATFQGGLTSDDPVQFDSDLTLTGLSTSTTDNVALVIDGNGDVCSRTLGSNAFNSTAFTTCTGTTTPSNSQTFTNKGGNISQWTNDSGYITDGNTNWNNSYGFTTCTGTTTPSNSQTFTNKGGNISQWTNNSGYTTCTGTSNLTLGTTSGTALAGNTTVNDVSVANLKTRLAGGFGSNAVQIGDATDTVTIPGELVVTGTVTTNNVETVSTSNGVTFEGNAADANELLLKACAVTSDRTIILPDADGTVALKSQISTHTSCLINNSGFITDGNTNWNNTYGFTTCTGTTTPSNTQTFTNKSGNISQWTNNSGYTTCTGTINTSGTVNSCEFPRFSDADTVVALTAAEMQAALNIADGATNVTNNNQLTNGCGYITDGNTNWDNSYGFTTCTGTVTGVSSANTNRISVGGTAAGPTVDAKTAAVANGGVSLATGDQIYDHVTTRISGLTSCTGTVTMTGGVNNRIVTAGGSTNIIGESGLTYDGSSFCVTSQANFFNAFCSRFGDDGAGLGYLVIGDDNFGSELGIMTDDDEAIAIKVGSCTFEFGGVEPFDSSIKVAAGSYNVLLNRTKHNSASGACNIVGGYLNTLTAYFSNIASGCNNSIGGGVYYSTIGGGWSNEIFGNGGLCVSNFIGGGKTNCICMGHSQTIVGGQANKIHDSACAIKSESRANWGAIVGGTSNQINGACYAFIGSGNSNIVCQSNAAVLGGGFSNDILCSNYSTIAGGCSNYISGTCSRYSAIAGGRNNNIQGRDGAILGGYNNCIQGMGAGVYSAIGGGHSNKTCAQYATIGGGCSNKICRSIMVQTGTGGTIAGGWLNCISGNYASIGGGCTNIIACNGGCATIAGGHSNCNHSPSSTIGGGAYNCIVASQGIYSVIGGGYSNCISTACCGQTIGGGKDNYICTGQYGQSGTIAGGCNNTIKGNNISSATVVGGSANCAKATGTVVGGVSAIANHCYATVFGCCLTSTAVKTAYFNNATVACHLQVGGTSTMSTTAGRIDATNDIVAFATSDRRLKENIKPIENALCKVIGVTGNTFDWKELSEQEIKDIHGNKGNDVGVIAQEIEEVLPQAVTTRDSGYKAVNYEKLIPLLIEAIKDQQKQIDELKNKVNGSS